MLDNNICKGGFTKDIIMIYRDCSGNKLSIMCGGMDVALEMTIREFWNSLS